MNIIICGNVNVMANFMLKCKTRGSHIRISEYRSIEILSSGPFMVRIELSFGLCFGLCSFHHKLLRISHQIFLLIVLELNAQAHWVSIMIILTDSYKICEEFQTPRILSMELTFTASWAPQKICLKRNVMLKHRALFSQRRLMTCRVISNNLSNPDIKWNIKSGVESRTMGMTCG